MIKRLNYNGVEYRLYESKTYYACGSSDAKRLNESMLHRQVWKDVNGDIPKGYCIQHVDHNPENNDISNLVLVDMHTHQSKHITERLKQGGDLHSALQKFRSSEKGKQQLRENAHKMKERTPEKACKCLICGESFNTKIHTQLYCSKECSTIAGRKGGKKKECPICGVMFYTKFSSKKETQTCGAKCGWVLRKQKI